jgi:hypothetical protein
MTSTDLFQQRANECRRLATAARKGNDKAFWLGLVERWQMLESQSAQRYRVEKVRKRAICKGHGPGQGSQSSRG